MIEREISKNLINPLDIDKIRYRYSESNGKVFIIAPEFELTVLEDNLYRLLHDKSKEVKFKSSWDYRPDYVSYFFYDTVIFWYIILFVNNINSIEDFVGLDKILVPEKTYLFSLANEAGLDKFEPKPLETHISSFVFDSWKITDRDNIRNLTKRLLKRKEKETIKTFSKKEHEDVFIIRQEDINNKYVKLSKEPLNQSSIIVKYKNNIVLRFGYSWTLIKKEETNEYFITWDSKYLLNSIGVVSLLEKHLKENDLLLVKYVITEDSNS